MPPSVMAIHPEDMKTKSWLNKKHNSLTDDTQTPVGEGGGGAEVQMGRRHAIGMGNALFPQAFN